MQASAEIQHEKCEADEERASLETMLKDKIDGNHATLVDEMKL